MVSAVELTTGRWCEKATRTQECLGAGHWECAWQVPAGWSRHGLLQRLCLSLHCIDGAAKTEGTVILEWEAPQRATCKVHHAKRMLGVRPRQEILPALVEEAESESF